MSNVVTTERTQKFQLSTLESQEIPLALGGTLWVWGEGWAGGRDLGAVGLQMVTEARRWVTLPGRDCTANPRASANDFLWRKEISQEGVAAEGPVTHGPGRVLPRDQGASGACGNGQCQGSGEAGRGFGGLGWYQRREETDKSLKNFVGQGEGRDRIVTGGGPEWKKRAFQMGEM